MYYDRPHERDERYARRLVFDANREMAQFTRQYQEAKRRNDQGRYLEANEQRTAVLDELARMSEEIPNLPNEAQGMVEEARVRVRECLDSHPEFPPPLINNETAVETHAKRLTRGQTSSEIVPRTKSKIAVGGSTGSERVTENKPTHPPQFLRELRGENIEIDQKEDSPFHPTPTSGRRSIIKRRAIQASALPSTIEKFNDHNNHKIGR